MILRVNTARNQAKLDSASVKHLTGMEAVEDEENDGIFETEMPGRTPRDWE